MYIFFVLLRFSRKYTINEVQQINIRDQCFFIIVKEYNRYLDYNSMYLLHLFYISDTCSNRSWCYYCFTCPVHFAPRNIQFMIIRINL